MTILSTAHLPPLSLSQNFLLVLCKLYFDFMPNLPWWNVGSPEDTTSAKSLMWNYFLSNSRPWEEEVNPCLLQHYFQLVLLSPPPNPSNWGASDTILLVTITQWLLATCSHSVVTPSHSPTAHHPSSPLLHSAQHSGWCQFPFWLLYPPEQFWQHTSFSQFLNSTCSSHPLPSVHPRSHRIRSIYKTKQNKKQLAEFT